MKQNIVKSSSNLQGSNENNLLRHSSYTLNDFFLQKKIGHGSFGNVYLAKLIKTGQIFAAKISIESIPELSKNQINDLLREVDIISKIDHPAIIKFILYSPTNFKGKQKPVIITELAQNGSLADLIRYSKKNPYSDTFNETRQLIIIYGIASAMSYLHSHGILHRDLKPANILLDDFLFPKVADFGLSKQDNSFNQSAGGIKGTPIYIAPEIYNKHKYSKASDVYAFAYIVYEIVTQNRPFANLNIIQIMGAITKLKRPEINEKTPKQFINLITSCWDQNPENRPSFDEILNQLRKDRSFITESINEEEYFKYIKFLDDHQSSFYSDLNVFNIKQKEIINFERTLENIKMKSKFFNYEDFVKLDEECRQQVIDAENEPDKQFTIGQCLIEGLYSFPLNMTVGLKYIKSSMKKGSKESLLYYCRMLIKGKIIPRDLDKAANLIKKYLNEQDPDFLLIYGLIAKKNKNYNKAKEYFIRSNNSEANFELSKFILKEAEDENDINKILEAGSALIQSESILKHPKAMHEYSEMLEEGDMFQENKELSIQYLKSAALKGNLESIDKYATILSKQPNSDQEYIKELYKKAADRGYLKSIFHYGMMLYNSPKTQSDKTLSIRFIKIACNEEVPEAMHQYGIMLLYGYDIPKDTDLAYFYFQKASDKGDPNALCQLMTFQRFVSTKTMIDFNHTLEMAQNSDNPDVMAQLSVLFFKKGQFNDAIQLCQTAIQLGNTNAMNILAFYYQVGCYIEFDEYFKLCFSGMALEKGRNYVLEKSLNWSKQKNDSYKQYAYDLYVMAIDNGDSDAMVHFADLLYYDYGDDNSKEIAIQYCKIAVENDNYKGMTLYSIFLLNENKNLTYNENVISLLNNAIRNNDTTAMRFFAHMLETGNGIPKDSDRAINFYKKAIDLEDLDAYNDYAQLICSKINLDDYYDENIYKKENQALNYIFYSTNTFHKNSYYYSFVSNRAKEISKNLYNKLFAILNKNIEEHNSYAAMRFALLYKNEDSFYTDINKAMTYLFKSVEFGNNLALIHIGMMYEKYPLKDSEKIEFKKAFYYYKEAIKKGVDEGFYRYGYLYEREGSSSKYEIKKLYKKAIADHNQDDLYKYGLFLYKNISINLSTFKKIILNQIKNGNIDAMRKYAYLTQDGNYKYLKMAIDKGDPEAMFIYSHVLSEPKNVAFNIITKVYNDNFKRYTKESLKYLKMAADNGYPDAICEYADYLSKDMYDDDKEIKEIEEYYKTALEKGSTLALNSYAEFLKKFKNYDKIKVKTMKLKYFIKQYEKDKFDCFICDDDEILNIYKPKAIEYYKKAIKKGNANAMFRYGYLLLYGKGVDIDKKKAIELFEKAANNGNCLAMIYLSYFYLAGEEVDLDEEESQSYLNKVKKLNLTNDFDININSLLISKLEKLLGDDFGDDYEQNEDINSERYGYRSTFNIFDDDLKSINDADSFENEFHQDTDSLFNMDFENENENDYDIDLIIDDILIDDKEMEEEETVEEEDEKVVEEEEDEYDENSFNSKLKINDISNSSFSISVPQELYGFILKDKREFKTCGFTCYLYENTKFKCPFLFIQTYDQNNFFNVHFRTQSKDNSGLKYIVKQMTSPNSHELVDSLYFNLNEYNFSSTIEAEFFDFLDVYLNSIFHPDFSEVKFMRICHHLHLKGSKINGKLSIKGLIYNKSVNDYLDPEKIFKNKNTEKLFPDSILRFDPNGIPNQIMKTTLKDVIDYHRKYYNPVNSFFYLYGNKSLPFDKVFKKVSEIIDKFDVIESPYYPELYEIMPWDAPVRSLISVPSNPTNELLITFVIDVKKPNSILMQNLEFLCSVLTYHLLMNLPAEYSTVRVTWEYKIYPCIYISIKDCDPSKNSTIESFIMESIKQFCYNETDQFIAKTTNLFHNIFKLNNRNCYLQNGNWFFKHCIELWSNGENPFDLIDVDSNLEISYQQCMTKGYLKMLATKFLLYNKNVHIAKMYHYNEYKKIQEEKENKILEKINSNLSSEDRSKIISNMKEIHKEEKRLKSIQVFKKINRSDISKKALFRQIDEVYKDRIFFFLNPKQGITRIEINIINDSCDMPNLWLITFLNKYLSKYRSIFFKNDDYIHNIDYIKHELRSSIKIERSDDCLTHAVLSLHFIIFDDNINSLSYIFKHLLTDIRWNKYVQFENYLQKFINKQQKNILKNIAAYNESRAGATLDENTAIYEAIEGLTGLNNFYKFINSNSTETIFYQCQKLYETILTNGKFKCIVSCTDDVKENAIQMIDYMILTIQKMPKISYKPVNYSKEIFEKNMNKKQLIKIPKPPGSVSFQKLCDFEYGKSFSCLKIIAKILNTKYPNYNPSFSRKIFTLTTKDDISPWSSYKEINDIIENIEKYINKRSVNEAVISLLSEIDEFYIRLYNILNDSVEERTGETNQFLRNLYLTVTVQDVLESTKYLKESEFNVSIASSLNMKITKFEIVNNDVNYLSLLASKEDIDKIIKELNIKANNNDAEAQYSLGVLYLEGIQVKKDVNKAINYFLLSANQNNQASQYCLAFIYYNNKNINKALQYFTRLSEQNYEHSNAMLGYIYSSGEFIHIDINKSIYYLSQAAKQNDKNANFYLGMYHLLNKNNNKGIDLLIQSSFSHDNANANFVLGFLYFEGKFVHKDIQKSIHYYKKASSFKYALNNLGILYKNDFGNEINLAIKCFDESINQNLNDKVTMYNLSHIFIYLDKTEEKINESIKLLIKSFKLGFCPSSYLLSIALIKKYGFLIEKIKQELIDQFHQSNEFSLKICRLIQKEKLNEVNNFERMYGIYENIDYLYDFNFMPIKLNQLSDLTSDFYNGF